MVKAQMFSYSDPVIVFAMTNVRGKGTVDHVAYALVKTVFVFGLITWAYVVAMQLRNPMYVYLPLALWVPIRLDYFGEAVFVSKHDRRLRPQVLGRKARKEKLVSACCAFAGSSRGKPGSVYPTLRKT